MGKWREESRVLSCSCKIGRSQQGVWFYDFICEQHLKKVQVDGKFNYEKSLKFTEKLNEMMKEEVKDREVIKNFSETETKAYFYVKSAKQPLAIRDMPHQLQGALSRLLSKKLVEIYKNPMKVTKHGFTNMKRIKCVRLK